MTIRLAPIGPAALDGVLAVQAAAHGAALLESAAVLASKLRAPGGTCWGAFAGTAAVGAPALCGYAIAYAQSPDAPLALHQLLPAGSAPRPGAWLYLHDIAVHPEHAGQRLAQRLLSQVLARARQHGLAQAMLVAVHGAEAYWARHGFRARPAPMPVSGFGDEAVWMMRAL